MRELKDLCLQDNNLVLVHDLNKAMVEARVWLLHQLWQEIECELKKIPDLPNKKNSDRGGFKENIEQFVRGQKNYKWRGIRYSFKPCFTLEVQVGDFIRIGVSCTKEKNKDEYNKLQEALEKALGRGKSSEWWVWFKDDPCPNLKHPTREDLELLANDESRQKYAAEVASGVGKVWDSIPASLRRHHDLL